MAEKKTAAKQAKRQSPTPKSGGKKSCTVQGCKRAYRAKSYCFFHYKKWRQGELPHRRFRTCSTAECRKPTVARGLCQQHLDAWKAARKGASEAAPAPAAAPAA